MEEYQRATSDIISNVNKLENILRESESVDAGNEKILNDLFNLRAKISEFSESKNELSGRTKALKEKIHSVDEKIKKESDEVKNRIRKYFKTLGIRVDQETMKDVENHIEITITFKEDSSASLSLAYDTLSEDFHLQSIQPEHQRFDELRDLLHRTRDLQSFLSMFRKFVSRRNQ